MPVLAVDRPIEQKQRFSVRCNVVLTQHMTKSAARTKIIVHGQRRHNITALPALKPMGSRARFCAHVEAKMGRE